MGSVMIEENVVSAAGTTHRDLDGRARPPDPLARQDPGAARHAVPRGTRLRLSRGRLEPLPRHRERSHPVSVGRDQYISEVVSKRPMRRRLLLIAVAALVLAAPAGAPTAHAHARRDIRQRSAVHAARPGRPERADRPAARGASDRSRPALSNETRSGTETLTAMQRRLASSATTAGVNGDFFSSNRRPERRSDAGRAGREPALRSTARVPASRRRDARRPADLASSGPGRGGGQADAQRAQRAAAGQRDRALHPAWGPATPAIPGRSPRSCSRCPRPSRTPTWPCRSSRCGAGGGPVPIPLGGARARRPRCRRGAALTAEAPVGQHGDHAPDLQAGLAGRRHGDRRRPQIVRNGAARVPGRRGVHDEPALAADLAHRPRTARGRAHDPGRRRRAPARLQRRDDELRARAGARAARRRDRHGARRGRLDDDGLRRVAAEPSLGRGAADLRRRSSCSTPACSCSRAVAVCRRTATAWMTARRSAYKVVQPSTVTVTLVGAERGCRLLEAVTRSRQHAGPFTRSTCRTALASTAPRGESRRAAEGKWKLAVTATDDVGQPSDDEPAVPRQLDARLPRRATRRSSSCRPAATSSASRGSRRRRRGSSSRSRLPRARSCAPSRRAATRPGRRA